MSFFKRRSIGKVLAVTMLFSVLMPAIAHGEEERFKDIADSYASREINQLAKTGVLLGYEDKRFQPSKAMTRAELAKIIALLLGLEESPDKAASYLDVRADSWYRGYVGALAEAGIVEGYSHTAFSPDSLVTREELVVFFIRGLGLEATAKQLPAESSLTDLAIVSEWARPHVALAHRIGFVDGIDNGDGTVAFNPKENAERQALARLAYEFQLHKENYVNAAKALITGAKPVKPEAAEEVAENVDIMDIRAVGLTAIEVTFGSAVKTVRKSDYSFDKGLTVTDAALKSGASNIVVLTIAGQLPGTTYKLAYKGRDTGKSVLIDSMFSGGGYSGSTEGTDGNENDTGSGVDTIETVIRQLTSGVAQETVTITASGTYGSENGPDTPVKRLIIDPGPTGEVTIQHIVPEVLEVLSGDVNTIKLQQTVIKQLRVNAVNNGGRDVRIETRDGTSVENTTVESQAVLESSSTTGKLGKIKLASSASGRSLTLKGNIDDEVTVDAPGAQVSIQAPSNGNPLPTVINKLSLAKNAKVNTGSGTKLSSVNVTGQNTTVDLSGQGSVSSVNVDPSASGTKLNLGEDTNVSTINADSDVTLSGSPDAIAKVKTEGSSSIQVDPNIQSEVKYKALANAVEAIEAVGRPITYSADLEEKLVQAGVAMEIAKLHGVLDSEILNLNKLTAAKETVNGWKEKVVQERLNLEIGYQSGDDAASVTKTLTLRTTSSLVDSIVWTPDKPAVVNPLTGVVVRPVAGEPDAVVTLTVQVSLNGYSEIRTFTVSVKAQAPVNNEKAEAIEAAIKAIEAVGAPVSYTADLEVKLAQADTA
ncbi:S-layer homology domain-containing protein, partial [Paenibacillus hemerocallicola]